jgi:hypothetical protein
MSSISAQPGGGGGVIDLAASTWRTRRRGERGNGETACCEDCNRFDGWLDSIGGIAGARYAELRAEAIEFAGPGDGAAAYLEMCAQLDRDHAAAAGKTLAAAEVELANANARSARAATRRAEAAAAATLRRAAEIKLAADRLSEHPRLAGDPSDDPAGFSTRAPMGRAEVDLELRAALGLASRAPTAYEATLPAVGELARTIGLRS